MSHNLPVITPELPSQSLEIEAVTAKIFGPGMFARAAFVLREGVAPEPHLSFVALQGERIVGTVRQTKIIVGGEQALLLGPLGVLPEFENAGVGHRLMEASMQAAGEDQDSAASLVLLVGDLAYYKRFGFKRVSAEKVVMPRPVEIGRVLACELQEGAISAVNGRAEPWG